MPVEELSYKSKKQKPKLPFILIFLAILILLIIGFLTFKGKSNTTNSKEQENTTTATQSARTNSDNCPEKEEYINTKQGYSVCYPKGWEQEEIKVSALTVGFDPKLITENSTPVLSVIIQDKAVDAALQETISNASKYEYGKAFVDKVAGTELIYTRGKLDPITTHKLVIDTLVSTTGRTYIIRLNTNEETRNIDEPIYREFLQSWFFLPETALPPWSQSRNILVSSPWINDSVKNPIHLSGEAIAFEAVVNIRIKDRDNHILLETNIQTQSGNERSPFNTDLAFNKPSTEKGVLEIFTISAADGSEQDKVIIPITFAE